MNSHLIMFSNDKPSERCARRWVLGALMAAAWFAPRLVQAEDKPPAPVAHVKKVQLDEFEKLLAEKKCTVLDVRTAKEFAAGHIAGAVNIDVKSPDFETKVKALDKDKVYVVHCARGGRSATACEKLDLLGFKLLYDFSGGMEAWKKAGKKTEP